MSQRDMSEQDQNAALEAYRAAACAEADAHFDDRALESQRHKILARLAHLGHPAKVIRFPKGRPVEAPVGGLNRRWVSAAAAAGLIIGLLGGQLVNLLPQNRRVSSMENAAAPPAPSVGPVFLPVSAPVDDDGLLGEIELVMQARTANELRALDEFTLDPR